MLEFIKACIISLIVGMVMGCSSGLVLKLIYKPHKQKHRKPVGTIKVIQDDEVTGLKQGDVVKCYLFNEYNWAYVKPVRQGEERRKHPFKRVLLPLFPSQYKRMK